MKKQQRDPATLLARGFTARFTGFVSGSMLEKSHRQTSLLQPLSTEEIEKDLRHITAFETAVMRYQQHCYATMNGISTTTTASSHPQRPSSQTTPSQQQHRSLPIRLDPDHDKRLAAQQKQMARAEVLREALEQEYVALRAHYVETAQQVSLLAGQQRDRLSFLQSHVQHTSAMVAYTRARLQMARDIWNALHHRQQLLATTTTLDDSTTTSSTANDTADHVLVRAWMPIEQAANELANSSSSSANLNMTTTSRASSKKNKTVLPWKSLTQPATPYGVPLLLSAASTAPEKSTAWLLDDPKRESACWDTTPANMNQTTNVNEKPLVWLTNHVPLTIPDEEDDDEDDDDQIDTDDDIALSDVSKLDSTHKSDQAILRELRRDVQWLERELKLEGQRNAEIMLETNKFRHHLDESTTMMALARQETESVLYRHNVVLTDADVVDKVEALADAEEEAASNRSISPMPPPSLDEGDTGSTSLALPPQLDEANFGDDEGDGSSMATGEKRSSADERELPRKRRKT